MNDANTTMLDELEGERPGGAAWSDRAQSAQVARLLNHLQSADGRLQIVRRNSEIVFQVRCPPLSSFHAKIDPSNRARIIVGANRAAANYSLDDHVSVGGLTLAKTVAETIDLTSAAADSYIYYLITASGSVSATLSSSTSWPLPAAGQQIVVLGKALWDSSAGAISKFSPLRYGQIELPPAPPATMDLVKITSHRSGQTYNCDIYGDGAASSATSTGEVLAIPQIISGDVLPANMWWQAIKIGAQYETQVPVWQTLGGAGLASAGPTGAVQTTDATPTTIVSVSLSENSTALISVKAVAYRTGGASRGGWDYSQVWYRIGSGTATLQGSTVAAVQEVGGYTITFTASAGNVLIQGTGAASETVNWHAYAAVVRT